MNMESLASGLQTFLDQELEEMRDSGEATEHDRFCAHRVCFESLIDHHSTYKELLSRIKAEYEECFAALERGQREVAYLSAKLASAVLEPLTLRNYRKRVDDLELKITLLKMANLRMESRLKPSRGSCDPFKSYLRFIQSKSVTPASVIPDVIQDSGQRCSSRALIVASWSLEQLTDTSFLSKKLAHLKGNARQVKLENETRFLPRETKGQLHSLLRGKEVIKEELLKTREDLKMRILNLKLSLAVEEKTLNISNRRGRGVPDFSNLAMAVRATQETMVKADKLCREEPEDKDRNAEPGKESYNQPSISNIDVDDDPRKDTDAEFILEYIENFAELFQTGKPEEAAMLAALSPKGCLRTPETVEKFKEYDESHPGSSVCLTYWEALLPTVCTGCPKPLEWESRECVACVLDKGRSDLLTHWIAQDQLTLTEEIGHLIKDACRCTESFWYGYGISGLGCVANLVMEDVEQRTLPSSTVKLSFWKRYADDVISAVPKDEVDSLPEHFTPFACRSNSRLSVNKTDNWPF